MKNPKNRLKVCNRSLGIVLLLILASGIQLEATAGRHAWSVWAHVVLGVTLCALSFYHIYLHYKKSNWFARFAKNPNKSTSILWWTFLLTAASGVAATAEWIAGGHTPVGGVHGKIGFLMVIVGIVHVAGHIRKKKNARKSRLPERSAEGDRRRGLNAAE